ncbi:TetR/AcrR family transcriptional regulator [Fructobacillus americanaquae]|uniref:TetR/AcrR family transcriptional regulator n=1 Tax=Fructobacillus americanaquae TaxID=2940302 RepID=A0ABY5C209_9LACO|nr:TetR/AcrR family transcriptional regulator [Fructobacillus americanaquae]USS92160.1 TetR/AcrR family transcriptional regulator [Fructobacillus americanaquae]
MDQIIQEFVKLSEEKKVPPSQKKVLQAAIQLFAGQGYASTSTAAITKEAGVSQAVIFKYFKNKEGLLDQILNLTIENLLPKYSDEFVAKLQDVAGHESFEEFLSFVLHDRFRFMDSNQDVLIILVAQLMVDETLMKKLENALTDKFWFLTKIIEELAGPDAKLSGQDILRLIASQMLLIFIEEKRMGLQLSGSTVEQRLEQTRQIILAGIYKIN